MMCRLCDERAKDWSGDDPACAFGENFSDNWNCATTNAIRSICNEDCTDEDGVDYQYCEDQKYSTVNVSEVNIPDHPYAMWVSWYKNRGRTDAIWLLFDRLPPRRPTEDECVMIAEYYGWRRG